MTEKTAVRGRRVRALRNSGRPEGGTAGSDKTMRLAALLPALLAEKMERAFVVGYGLGMTVGELASLSSMREVIVAEISPGVIEAAPFFDDASLGASSHPAVKIVNSDAYRALIRSEGTFDAIVSIPSHTWVAGVEMLFSREFLEAVRDRLTPGGVYLQWFHTNGLQGNEAEPTALALRTFAAVFPYVTVWYGSGTELLIVGLKDDHNALDLDRIDRLSHRKDIAAGLARAKLRESPDARRPRAAAARRRPRRLPARADPHAAAPAAGKPGRPRRLLGRGRRAAPHGRPGDRERGATQFAATPLRGALRRPSARVGTREPGRAAVPPPESRVPDAARRLDPRRPRFADAGDRVVDAPRRIEGKDRSQLRSVAAAAVRRRHEGGSRHDARGGCADDRHVHRLLHARRAVSPLWSWPTSGAVARRFRRSGTPAAPGAPRPTFASATSRPRSRSRGTPRGGRRSVSAVQRSRPRWQEPATIQAWLLVLAWLALILLLSSDSFSSPSTGSLLRPLLRWLFPEWSAAEIRMLHAAIRKAAHVSVYGVLALLAFRAFRLSLAATALRHAGLAIALVLVAAATDEHRQSLSRARTGSLADVGYDLAGGVARARDRRRLAARARRPPPSPAASLMGSIHPIPGR